MPDIAPFKAFYYDTKNQAELESLVAPPHDVISPAERSAYLRKNPDNIVQIIIPDSYVKAAQILNGWIERKSLIQQETPAFYVYETKNMQNNSEKKRYGLIALVEITNFSEKKIIPHEKTFKRVSEDRFNLFRETNANCNPIFFIFNGNDIYTKIIQKTILQPSFLTAQDRDGVTHTLWIMDNTQDISTLQTYFKTIPLTIADGHHRYGSALDLSRENGSKYIMGLLVDMNDPGLSVFPTHRLVRHVPNLNNTQILDRIKKYFNYKVFKFAQSAPMAKLSQVLAELESQSHRTFALLLYNASDFFIISLKNENPPESLIQEQFSDEWKRLDVSILHEFVFKKLLDIPQFIDDSDNIMYIKNLEEAIEAVQRGLYQALFILNPTKVEQILNITAGSEIMPHKATYFYPKPLSGLVIYKWDSKE